MTDIAPLLPMPVARLPKTQMNVSILANLVLFHDHQMFDQIVLRRAQGNAPISCGQIAEAMLYYQKVHLIIDRNTIDRIIPQIGTTGLLRLLARPGVSAVYCDEMLGTRTDTIGATDFHEFIAFMLSGDQDGTMFCTAEERLQHQVQRLGICKKDAAKFAVHFLNKVPRRVYSKNHFVKTNGGVLQVAKAVLLDNQAMRTAALQAAIDQVGGETFEKQPLQFECIETPQGNVIFTNIDFAALNMRRGSHVPPLETIKLANLLSSVLEASVDISLAARYGGDFRTSAESSAIIRVRHAELMRRHDLNSESRHQFSEIVLPGAPSLQEVIDSGAHSFDEFLKLLDKSDRFKRWLGALNPDVGLVQSYLQEITKEDWIQSLPAKIVRYVLTLGADGAAPSAGVVAGLADNFIVEKIFAGWRPNHFVDRKLSRFLG